MSFRGEFLGEDVGVAVHVEGDEEVEEDDPGEEFHGLGVHVRGEVYGASVEANGWRVRGGGVPRYLSDRYWMRMKMVIEGRMMGIPPQYMRAEKIIAMVKPYLDSMSNSGGRRQALSSL